MAGISSKALNFGEPKNKEKTFQGQRFDDELGLNWIQFKWRNHDPQIGRFIQIDPLADEYEYNSTYAFSENRVTSSVEIEGLEAKDLYNELGPVREHRAKYGMPEDPKEIKIAKAVIGGLILLITPGPDELVLLGVATKLARTEKAVDAVVDTKKAIDKAVDVEKTADKATDLKKAEERAAKLSEKERPGEDFTKAGKEAVKDVNKAKNNGQTTCEGCGVKTTPAQQSKKGVTPSKTETQVDHVKRKSEGGSGTPNNGQVLCRGCNLEKH
jgi:RHS repeat-associated protein